MFDQVNVYLVCVFEMEAEVAQIWRVLKRFVVVCIVQVVASRDELESTCGYCCLHWSYFNKRMQFLVFIHCCGLMNIRDSFPVGSILISPSEDMDHFN